ncbi:MAG: carboxypeptidase-like regulatory domain-containing protein [ANME-2 cluster archaeon]|nr:carboxypeptidase-like regulatory domain-containing protein [ANME-2 cluster archaeon]
MYKRIALILAVVSVLATVLTGNAAADVVVTASGDPIEGALVQLVDYPQYNDTTDVNGNYTIPNVPIGTYLISASAEGYATNTSSVIVSDGVTTEKNFILDVGFEIFIPWTATTQGWTTPYVVVNQGTVNATVTMEYYDSVNGSLVGTDSMIIPPGASKFAFREWVASGTDGSVKVISDQPISVLVDQLKPADTTFGAYSAGSGGSTQVFIPWTATTQGWTTPYVIVNQGNVNASVTMEYYDSVNGSLVGTDSMIIPPGASKFAFREWVAAGTDGSAKVISDQPISVLVDQLKPADTTFGAYSAGAGGSTQVFIPWTATTQGWTTPYVIVNQGIVNASVTMEYYDSVNGSLVGTDSMVVLPGASKFAFREWVAAGTDGSAKITSDQNISVIVDQLKPADTTFGAYSAGTGGSTQVFIPWTATTQGWTTPYVIVNQGSVNATVNMEYYDSVNGSLVGTDSMIILPGASKFAFREWVAAGTDGSVKVISDQPISVLADQLKPADTTFGAYSVK